MYRGSASDLIQAAGGFQAVATLTGHHITTIYRWNKRRTIPDPVAEAAILAAIATKNGESVAVGHSVGSAAGGVSLQRIAPGGKVASIDRLEAGAAIELGLELVAAGRRAGAA